jgi:hypothetical protein
MNLILKKEMRALSLTFAATIGLTILAAVVFHGSDADDFVLFCYVAGALLMAATIFGYEFNSRTMLQLLSQPTPREQIWRSKMSVLGIELAISYAVFFIAWAFRSRSYRALDLELAALVLAFLPLIICCSTPCLTLRTKNTLGAIAFSILIPWIIVMMFVCADAVVCWFLGRQQSLGEAATAAHPVLILICVTLFALIYCVIFYRLGFRTFMNFQVIDSQPQEISLPAVLEKSLARWTAKLAPGYTGPFASLVRKELRFHRPSFMVAGFLVIVLAALTLAFKIHPSEYITGSMMGLTWLCAFVVLAFTGLVTVAEERTLGVLEWQLTQPISKAKQWAVKMLVAVCVCLALGVIFPGVAFYFGQYLLGKWPEPFHVPHFPQESFITLSVFSLIVFASSICANVSRAATAFVGVIICVGSAMGLVNYKMSNLGLNALRPDSDYLTLAAWSAVAGIVLVNLFSFANFRMPHLTKSRIIKQIIAITLFTILASFLTLLLGAT